MNLFAPADDALALIRWSFVSVFIAGALAMAVFHWGGEHADD